MSGYKFIGTEVDDLAGISVSSAGDVDGDGKDDLIIGAFRADGGGDRSGEAFLITAGDVDGDGKDDLIIGARGADGGGDQSGEAYLLTAADLAAADAADGAIDGVIDLDNVNEQSTSYQFIGTEAGDLAGISVSSAGDVDGDGKDDMIIGAATADGGGAGSGEAYLITAADLAAADAADGVTDGVIDLDNVNEQPASYQFIGTEAGDIAATSVSSAGDVDGDGKGDLIIGAMNADGGGIDSGEAYLITAADLAAADTADGVTDGVIDLDNVNEQSTSYQFIGTEAWDTAGNSVSSAGDVVGDGKDDLIIGAPLADGGGANSGESYLLTAADLAAADARDGAIDGVIDLDNANCFAAGTLISTPNGERPVEALAPGDIILTAQGRAMPVRFNLHQTIPHARVRMPQRFTPVRIRAGALGGALPHTDLTVTADHGMIIDGLIINASALVNGTSINWVPMDELPDSVTYYHIETDTHAVIVANGAPTETFIDYVGRQAFDNYVEYLGLYGAERIIPEMPQPRISAGRLVPEQVRQRLGIKCENFEYEARLTA